MGRPDLSLVPLTRDDFPAVVAWLAQPHVSEWWHHPQGLAQCETEFGPCVDGDDPTLVFCCLLDGEPIGLVQMYRVDDEPAYAAAIDVPAAAGLDLFIGEAERCDRGLGPDIIGLAVERIWHQYPEVTAAVASPSARNARSIRAFEKAGFAVRGPVRVPGEIDEEILLICPRPTTG